ncbi:PAXX isoform X1 [Pelobates cultripes]|uniref:PAXX isoform X1 n=1 Tax=Pelobates cultripes TaxID=61616 RepID=A0AAD1T3E3_PELCU|nr:PAXX isoform X1 [Pelobates cultripes]
MDSKRQSHVTLCSLRHDGQRYLCHGRQQSQETGSLDLFVTNGIDVWKADVTKEAQEQWNTASTLSNSSDGLESLREVLGRTPPLLDVQGSLVTLTLQLISGNVILDLFKLPISETRMHLQTLVFSLADQLTDMEKLQREGSVTTSVSPVKPALRNNFMHIPDVEVRRRCYGVPTKKRLPGESLVNPGCKSKKAATGVDFDES